MRDGYGPRVLAVTGLAAANIIFFFAAGCGEPPRAPGPRPAAAGRPTPAPAPAHSPASAWELTVAPPEGFDRAAAAEQTLRHLSALIALDTQNPPGNERVPLAALGWGTEFLYRALSAVALSPDDS